jgi:hypothetical protein
MDNYVNTIEYQLIIALEEGKCVHEQITESGRKSDLFVGNIMLDMYAKCGSMEDARRVFK